MARCDRRVDGLILGPPGGLTAPAAGYRTEVPRETATTATATPNEVLADRFVLEHVLGHGGMATVWSAYDQRLCRTVAVKVLQPGMTDEHAERIEREARAAARVDDPRVVRVLDLHHTDDGTPFLVLEALDGRTLADELHGGPLPVERVERLADDLLGALAAAHARGVLHRDVKPSNILLDGEGFRISDFGIASLDDDATNGDLMGTLVYLAPERLTGAPATPRSDVFAAAAVLSEALTGRQPFRGGSTSESLDRLRRGEAAPLPSQVPVRLRRPIERALDPDPGHRPTDAGAFARMLTADPDLPTERINLLAMTDTGEEDGDAGPPTMITDGPVTAITDAPTAPGAVVDGPAPGTTSVFETESQHSDRRSRRARWLFAGLAVLLFVLAVATAATGSTGASDAPADRTPAGQLDHTLDQIEELGR